MSLEWTGKGSNTRPLEVTKAEKDASHDRIFGKRMTWLDKKMIAEAWVKPLQGVK